MVVMVKRPNTSACDADIRRFKSDWPPFEHADVAELADALGLGPSVLKDVKVRVLLSAFACVVDSVAIHTLTCDKSKL